MIFINFGLNNKAATPASEDLFKIKDDSLKHESKQAKNPCFCYKRFIYIQENMT